MLNYVHIPQKQIMPIDGNQKLQKDRKCRRQNDMGKQRTTSMEQRIQRIKSRMTTQKITQFILSLIMNCYWKMLTIIYTCISRAWHSGIPSANYTCKLCWHVL